MPKLPDEKTIAEMERSIKAGVDAQPGTFASHCPTNDSWAIFRKADWDNSARWTIFYAPEIHDLAATVQAAQVRWHKLRDGESSISPRVLSESLHLNHDYHRVVELCERIGYGRAMQCASEGWRRKAVEEGWTGMGCLVGPHHGDTEPCWHPSADPHCNFCNGCGWVTTGVADLMRRAGH